MKDDKQRGKRSEKKKAFGNVSGSKRWLWVIVLLLVLALALGMAGYGVYKWLHSNQFNPRTMFQTHAASYPGAEATPAQVKTVSQTPDVSPVPAATPVPADWVYYGGGYYKPRTDVVSLLFMGIDTQERELHAAWNFNSYQADTVMLCVIDTAARSMKILNIPRDVTTPVKVLDMFFNYSRTEDAPLCVQHAYGDGGDMSAQLMMDAVRTLLYNVPVNQYVDMDLSGNAAATDAVGGVELTLLEDFTAENSHMRKGRTMTLNGKQATIYVQRRTLSSFDNTLNASRMERQVQFCKAFLSKVKEKVKADPTFTVTLYNRMKDSFVSNLSMDEALYLANLGLDVGFQEDMFEKLAVFDASTEDVIDVRPDEEAIKAQIIGLFYERADG